MYAYGTLKPGEVILSRGVEKRDNNGGNELNWVVMYVYMEMSQ
jgi:hypothetical protein